MDLRYFELQDLLSEALIALEAGNCPRAMVAVKKIARWAEADWLATASELPVTGSIPSPALDEPDEED